MRPPAPVLPDITRGKAKNQLLVALSLLALSAATTGCFTQQTPRAKATDAARELNSALRWGRNDVALERASNKDREDFLKRHGGWGTTQRILDSEVAVLEMIDATHAVVQVDVSWLLDDDTNLRNTRLEQKWSDADGKWVLTEEKRLSGAEGIFGEDVERSKPKQDHHFPTRVIR